VLSSRNADIKPGNNLPLRFIPLGTTIHNIELKISGGAQMCRSAGTGAQVMAKEGDWGQVRLAVGRDPPRPPRLPRHRRPGRQHRARQRARRQGRAHALEGPPPAQPRRHHEPGRSPDGRRRRPFVGGRHPCSPWGQLSKGLKTRENKRTDAMIIKHRGKKA
jgi:large subunit ribosomal protein L2